jgi:hypothetical protein
MGPQSCGNPNFGKFGTPIWGSPGTKCHLDVGLVKRHKVYYQGDGCGFPLVQAMVSFVSPSLHVAHRNTKNVVTNLLVGFVLMQVCVNE